MDIPAISEQKRVNEILSQAFKKNRIPSAYLFTGSDNRIKMRTAMNFIKLVNCEKGEVCGICENCDKIERSIHPDVLIIEPEGVSIKIDQIREISSFARFGPVSGKYKVIVVNKADMMTNEAFTGFLKTLEEPIKSVLFILLTTREDSILGTV